MTPRPVLPDFARATLAALFIVAAGGAGARPLDLSSDAGVSTLARWLVDYRAVAHAHWVIAAPDRATAEAKRAALSARLDPIDRDLLARVDMETSSAATTPTAWMQPTLNSSNPAPKCAWQVWVADPAIPGPDEAPVMTPLAPNDRIPVSTAATFRVGHAGLLQSRLYAFGETQPGALRDLATAPDVNLPVVGEANGETIVLATSREPAPFLEGLKSALSDSRGERRDLGARYSLRDKVAGNDRGIGANIQAIPQTMIAEPTAQKTAPAAATDLSGAALLETCVYQMSPRR